MAEVVSAGSRALGAEAPLLLREGSVTFVISSGVQDLDTLLTRCILMSLIEDSDFLRHLTVSRIIAEGALLPQREIDFLNSQDQVIVIGWPSDSLEFVTSSVTFVAPMSPEPSPISWGLVSFYHGNSHTMAGALWALVVGEGAPLPPFIDSLNSYTDQTLMSSSEVEHVGELILMSESYLQYYFAGQPIPRLFREALESFVMRSSIMARFLDRAVTTSDAFDLLIVDAVDQSLKYRRRCRMVTVSTFAREMRDHMFRIFNSDARYDTLIVRTLAGDGIYTYHVQNLRDDKTDAFCRPLGGYGKKSQGVFQYPDLISIIRNGIVTIQV